MANDEVLVAMRRQLECYQRLAKLANAQHEHVQDSRTEELLGVLSQRQKLLEEMSQLERIILPAKRNWRGYADALPPVERAEAEELIGAIRRLLEDIAAADRDDTLVLQQRKLNLGKGINQAAVARKFNNAYTKAAYAPARERLDTQR